MGKPDCCPKESMILCTALGFNLLPCLLMNREVSFSQLNDSLIGIHRWIFSTPLLVNRTYLSLSPLPERTIADWSSKSISSISISQISLTLKPVSKQKITMVLARGSSEFSAVRRTFDNSHLVRVRGNFLPVFALLK